MKQNTNKKKGIAKKAISVSLVAAMLATTNVPVWADSVIEDLDVPVAASSVENQDAPMLGSAIAGSIKDMPATVDFKDTIAPDFTKIEHADGEDLTFEWQVKDADASDDAYTKIAGTGSTKTFTFDDVTKVKVGQVIRVVVSTASQTNEIASTPVLAKAKALTNAEFVVDFESSVKSAWDLGKDWTGQPIPVTDADLDVKINPGSSGEVALTAGDDFTYTVSDTTVPGTATITITLTGSKGYSGTYSGLTFEVKSVSALKIELSDVAADNQYEYTGREITPKVKSVTAANGAVLGTDQYEVLPLEGTGVDTYKVKVVGTGALFTGAAGETSGKPVSIVPKDIKNVRIEVDATFDPTDGTTPANLAKIHVYDDAVDPKTELASSQYTPTLENESVDRLPTTIKIEGKGAKGVATAANGNYHGTATKEVAKVTEKDISKIATFTAAVGNAARTYNGNASSAFNGAKHNPITKYQEIDGLYETADFTVEVVSGGTDVGPIGLKFTGTGSYTGSFITYDFKVKQLDLNGAEAAGTIVVTPTDANAKYTFDPSIENAADADVNSTSKLYPTPSLQVSIKETGYVLQPGVDYYLERTDGTAGTNGTITLSALTSEVKNSKGAVIYTGSKNFTDTKGSASVTKAFTKDPKSLKDADVKITVDDAFFTGEATRPDVTVVYNGFTYNKDGKNADGRTDTTKYAKFDDHFTATYYNSSDLGTNTASVLVASKVAAQYKDTRTVKFSVKGATLAGGKIVNTFDRKDTLKSVKYDADLAAKDGIELDSADYLVLDSKGGVVDSKYYTVSYANNKAVGTATITVTGKNGYDGKLTNTYTIAARLLPSGTFTVGATFTYTGEAIELTAGKDYSLTGDLADLKAGTDYILRYENNKNAGTATVVLEGTGNYYGSINKTFSIHPVKITAQDIIVGEAGYAQGQAVKPSVTVSIPATGNKLEEGIDYSVSYTNVTMPGEEGIINFTWNDDSSTKDFGGEAGNVDGSSIAQVAFKVGAMDMKNLTIDAIADQTYTSKAIEPALTVKNGNVILTKDVDYTVTFKDNTAVGTATATVAPVAGSTKYTGSKDITFKIVADKPATPILVLGNNTTTGIKLAWNDIEDATGYVVYGYNKADMKTIVDRKVVKGTSVTLTYNPGTSKSFVVRAYKTVNGKNIYSGISNKVVTATKPNKTDIKSITVGKGIAKVYTSVGKGATGAAYCISYDGGETFKIVAKGPKGVVGSTNYIMKGLKKGSAVIKIRGYVKDHDGKTVYGDWSKAVKVTIK